LATKVGFSGAPFNTNPLPDPLDPAVSLSVDGADAPGAGDRGFGDSIATVETMGGVAGLEADAAISSTEGSVIFVPSVHSIVSGAQSSSSSSMSAQFACLFGSSDWSLVAR
jgi:hypothetical protein